MTTTWQSEITIDVSQDVGTLVLRLGGELDAGTRAVVEPAVMAAVPTAYAVDLDLTDLTFCDSSGVAMLIAAHDEARKVGTDLTLIHVRSNISRLFDITGVTGILNIR